MQFFECSISAPSSIESQSFMEFYRKRKKLQIHHISRVMQSHVVNMSYENERGISRIYYSPLFFSTQNEYFNSLLLFLFVLAEGIKVEERKFHKRNSASIFERAFFTWLDFTTLSNLIMCK